MFLLNNYLIPLYSPEGEGAGEPGEGEGEGQGSAPPPEPIAGGEEGGEVSWRDFVSDERLKPTADKYTSLDDFIVAYNRMGGELRSRIKVPGEDASDEDTAAWRKALGVPQDATGYSVSEIEDYEYTDDDLGVIEDMKAWALDHNIPASAFDALVQDWVGRTLEIRDQYAKIIEEAAADAQDELIMEWGPDYDMNIANCARAAVTYGGDDFIDFLDDMKIEGFGKLGDHPQMVKFLANIGRRTIDEGEIMLQSSSEERMSAQQRIDQIQKENPPGTPGYTDPSVQAELQKLYEIVAGNAPITGSPG